MQNNCSRKLLSTPLPNVTRLGTEDFEHMASLLISIMSSFKKTIDDNTFFRVN